MFTSFRQRLLFCFMLIISITFLIVALTHFHLITRNRILHSTSLIESSYVLLLKDVNARQRFFNQDTHNLDFFSSGKSENLQAHRALRDSVLRVADKAYESFKFLPYTFDSSLIQFSKQFTRNDLLFDTIVGLVRKRGYKDYNLEGAMRKSVHKLEKNKVIPTESILTLRRHEKDYIIRNETEYVTKLNALSDDLLKRYADRNDSTFINLSAYRQRFNEIVALDNRIGLKGNNGLKKILDEGTVNLEGFLSNVVVQAQARQDQLFAQLNRIYLFLCAFLVLLSLIGSFVIAQKITKPLTELTEFITRFIDSQFTVEEQSPKVRSQDEIGKLTANFTLLKNEVISYLKFFRQKVDERTAEIQTANKRLKAINEANSRFVPREFLDYLQKNSIEEVMPGDQVAREMTVLFTDIRSFTQISESLSPQDSFDFVNAYLAEIVPVIKEHNGFIDKFIGDSVMAIFPESRDAIKAGLEFTGAVERFNLYLSKKNISPIAIGTGIHTGQLVLGTIGNAHRLETTVISDAVNIASRVEGLTKHYDAGIIVSEEAIQKAGDAGFYCRYLDEVRVKGKLKSVRVYEILNPATDQLKVGLLKPYDAAISYLRDRKLAEARIILNDLASRNPTDNVLKILIQRCEKLMEQGFPNEWDGIESIHFK